jgi:hypothetical protein
MGEWMPTEKKYCSICAWRRDCQKRFSIVTDASGNVRCPDFTRDVSIKDDNIEASEKSWQEE